MNYLIFERSRLTSAGFLPHISLDQVVEKSCRNVNVDNNVGKLFLKAFIEQLVNKSDTQGTQNGH